MELMRHSDMRLPAKVFTDAGLLPLGKTMQSRPSLLRDSQIDSHILVSGCPKVSGTVHKASAVSAPQPDDLKAEIVRLCPKPSFKQNGARCRVRTCDPIRVKDVLYR